MLLCCLFTSVRRAIIHLDMDCFYAAIEVRDHPELAGKPVAVGGARDRRGVLTTCNYEARKFGVRSGMPTFKALQHCADLIVMPTRFEVYRRESAKIREILLRFSPLVEPLSLDEAFLDVSHHDGDPAALAQIIRQLIYQNTQLTASAGIAPNKMLAKIASDWNKPDGQLEIKPENVAEFMQELPVHKLWGIGAKSAEKFAHLGIRTCGELQRCSRIQLYEWFGKFGLELYLLGRGDDRREVMPDRERKSLSNERTFTIDLTSLAQCEARIPDLFEELIADLKRTGGEDRIKAVFVKIRFADFTRTTVERAGLPLEAESFLRLLREGLQRKDLGVRLLGLGVRFSEEEPASATQLELW
ncbi:MAG: DNA polymerase IV [Verrucomicrobia bacterium]|nr:DNA polymerase IV [Verrucomicrobiota bacterium]